ncbi:MAG: hypothetical protein KAJ51_14060 [Thermoplasmata archaeon]|nr:hypothetical protein [Thermoplasmata archaeon]
MFLLGYIIVIGISFAVTFSLLVSGIGSAYYIYYTITETLAIILSFFLGFMILFLVKEFVNPRIKDLLYIFAGLMVLIPIFQVIVWIFLPISLTTDFYWLDEPVLIAMTFFTLLHSIMWGLAAFVFYNINKGLKIHGRTIPKEPPSFLPRPEPVAKYAGEFYLRPKRAIFGVVVVTIILGVALGASYYVPNESDSSSSRFPEDMYDESPHSYGYTEFGEIFERETKQLELDLFCEVFSFRVDFYWTDEPDAPMRDNEPDRFTLEVNLGALSDSDSQENSQGDMGHIYIEWEFDVEDPRFIDYAEIVITLDDAGDQTGPGGIAQSPLTIEDNSNEFQLDVSYFYQAEL